MNNEPTNMEILEALNSFSSKMDKRIDELEKNLNQKIDGLRQEINERLDYHETWLNRIEKRFEKIETRLSNIEERLSNVENSIVTLVVLLKDKEVISVRESARFLQPKIIS